MESTARSILQYARPPRRATGRGLRIAQVSPLQESVPPRKYGGTERVVYNLCEELSKLGHEVTLFASGDSRTSARLISGSEVSLRQDRECVLRLPHEIVMLDRVREASRRFDLIHFHTDWPHFLLTHCLEAPSLTTVHGRTDLRDLAPLYRHFIDVPLIAISEAHRKAVPWANWIGTVHHGLPEDSFPFSPGTGEYFAFLGRMSPEKRPDRAIAIAKAAGVKLKMAVKIESHEVEYFERTIKPLLADPLIEFLGEICEEDKAEFLGRAKALLFPIDWPEPFGIVMIEALACGTPVIAFRCGSVPEIIEDGRTGFVVDSLEEAIAAARRIGSISRAACRAEFERRFTASRMVEDYLTIYERLVRGGEVAFPLSAYD